MAQKVKSRSLRELERLLNRTSIKERDLQIAYLIEASNIQPKTREDIDSLIRMFWMAYNIFNPADKQSAVILYDVMEKLFLHITSPDKKELLKNGYIPNFLGRSSDHDQHSTSKRRMAFGRGIGLGLLLFFIAIPFLQDAEIFDTMAAGSRLIVEGVQEMISEFIQ